MLSKLESIGSHGESPASSVESQALQTALERHFRLPRHSTSLARAAGGTLGVCFRVELSGTRRFLKTHLPDERARANLAKEASILHQLYGDAVVIECIEVEPENSSPRLCLLMTELSHLPAPMSAEDAAAMVHSFTQGLAGFHSAGLKAEWDFGRYLAHGRCAIVALVDHALITMRTARELERNLDLLGRELSALPRGLCHGDLGPRNIMMDGSKAIAIDWEDAFWGVIGYDYLYWLTFMENRPHLHSSAFGLAVLDVHVARAILALVVLLKSYLSVRTGTYVSNTVPIEVRISEVLALPRGC